MKSLSSPPLRWHLALLSAAVSALAIACTDDAAGPPPTARTQRAATPVLAEQVRLEAQRTRVEAVGTARALRSVELYPEAAGEVVAVRFQPGQRVTAGSVLVELDARDQRLALELTGVRLDEAQRLLDRYEAANRRGDPTVPATTVDTARSAQQAARIDRDRARVALDNRFVVAPFDGIVGLTDVDVGDRIDPATLITSLDDRSELLVRFDVPEAFVGRLVPGDGIEIETWTANRTRARGEVVDLDSRIDPVSRAFGARALVSNAEDRLRPGMSFRVTLELLGREWPTVPEVSVMWGGDGAYVWIVEDGLARRVAASIVQRSQGRVLVDAELAPGTLVVSEGVQRMRANLPVRVLDADALVRDARAELAQEPAPTGARE